MLFQVVGKLWFLYALLQLLSRVPVANPFSFASFPWVALRSIDLRRHGGWVTNEHNNGLAMNLFYTRAISQAAGLTD
jgi:hypothetical protein